MGRHPEGNIARMAVVSIRMTREERKQLDLQAWERGNLSRGQYIRGLVKDDRDRKQAGDNG